MEEEEEGGNVATRERQACRTAALASSEVASVRCPACAYALASLAVASSDEMEEDDEEDEEALFCCSSMRATAPPSASKNAAASPPRPPLPPPFLAAARERARSRALSSSSGSAVPEAPRLERAWRSSEASASSGCGVGVVGDAVGVVSDGRWTASNRQHRRGNPAVLLLRIADFKHLGIKGLARGAVIVALLLSMKDGAARAARERAAIGSSKNEKVECFSFVSLPSTRDSLSSVSLPFPQFLTLSLTCAPYTKRKRKIKEVRFMK